MGNQKVFYKDGMERMEKDDDDRVSFPYSYEGFMIHRVFPGGYDIYKNGHKVGSFATFFAATTWIEKQ